MAAVGSHLLIANKSVPSLRPTDESSASKLSDNSSRASSYRDAEHILDYYQSEDAGHSAVDAKSANSQGAQSEQEHPSRDPLSILRTQSAARDTTAGAGRASMESVASSASGGAQRRTSQRSARGGDKRRMAIVETDSPYESQASSLAPQGSYTSESTYHLLAENSLLTRRGMDISRFDGLALVAPPDVNLSTFAGLSPTPTSAPATGVPPALTSTLSSGHQRSMSDAQSRKKTSPRDVGIVGTLETMSTASPSAALRAEAPLVESSERGRPSTANSDQGSSLTAPVFQTPKSRSPSPLPPAGDPSSSQGIRREWPLSTREWTADSGLQLTPNVIQEKEISRAVRGPAVVDLTSGVPVFRRSPNVIPSGLPIMELPTSERDHPQRSAGRLPFKPNQAGPTYLHYQPGVHATAGPLPSLPRHIVTQANTSPPPRPPRLLSPPMSTRKNDGDDFKRSNKPPGSSGKDGRSSERSPKIPEDDWPISSPLGPKDAHEKPHMTFLRSGSHVREGAFPASSVFLSRPPQSFSQHGSHTLDEPTATVGVTINKEDSLSSNDVPPSTVVEPSRALRQSLRPDLKREEGWASEDAESVGDGVYETSPPSSYPPSLEGSMRISAVDLLPDDERLNTNGRRASLPATADSQRQIHSLPRTPSLSFARNKSRASPLSFQPPLAKKAPSSWPEAMNFHQILTKKTAAERALSYAQKIQELASEETGLRDWLVFNARKERRGTQASTSATAISFHRGSTRHLRHVSRSSMASEVTFPIRADSYTATDLSLRPTTDTSSPTSPPPSLPYPSLAHGVGIRSHHSTQSDSSSRAMTSSTSSRTLGGVFFSSLGRKTSMRKDRTLSPASSNKLTSSRQTSSLPQPRSVKIAAPPTIPGGPRAPARRANSVTPAPGETLPSESQGLPLPSHPPAASTEMFQLQVEKLCDLLPQADKDVLAIYLRRANNQDPMLAIGAYLEDEKQGTLLSA